MQTWHTYIHIHNIYIYIHLHKAVPDVCSIHTQTQANISVSFVAVSSYCCCSRSFCFYQCQVEERANEQESMRAVSIVGGLHKYTHTHIRIYRATHGTQIDKLCYNKMCYMQNIKIDANSYINCNWCCYCQLLTECSNNAQHPWAIFEIPRCFRTASWILIWPR